MSSSSAHLIFKSDGRIRASFEPIFLDAEITLLLILAEICRLLALFEILEKRPANAPLKANNLSAFDMQKPKIISMMIIQMGMRIAIRKSHTVAPGVVIHKYLFA